MEPTEIAEMSFKPNTTIPDYENMFVQQEKKYNYVHTIRMLTLIGYLIISTLGLVLNPAAITAAIYSGGKTAAAKCVLSLAVTHLLFSASLPWQILYSWYHFNWHYGTFLCKVSSYVFYFSMFSTAGILTLWSVKGKAMRCFRFQHTSGVLIAILCCWIFAAILSIPSLYSRELQYTELGMQCVEDFDLEDTKTMTYGIEIQKAVVWYRFLLGTVIPGFLIFICGCCQSSRMERKLKKISGLVKIAYFLCWTPLLFMGLLQTFGFNYDLSYGLPVATVLAAAHCCVNPIIYLLVSQNHPVKWMKPAKPNMGQMAVFNP